MSTTFSGPVADAIIDAVLVKAAEVQEDLDWITGAEVETDTGSRYASAASVDPSTVSGACAIGDVWLAVRALGLEDAEVETGHGWNQTIVQAVEQRVVEAVNQNAHRFDMDEDERPYVTIAEDVYFEDGEYAGQLDREVPDPDWSPTVDSLPEFNDNGWAKSADDVILAFNLARKSR